MSSVFPYGITLQESGKVAVFPAAEVRFQTAEGEFLSLFLIIDSGASISALPKSDAPFLNVMLEEGERIVVGGISGEPIHGWRHVVEVKLGNETLHLPIVFIDSESAPRVLGREGIFDCFSIIFEETKRQTGFLSSHTPEAKRISQVLDEII